MPFSQVRTGEETSGRDLLLWVPPGRPWGWNPRIQTFYLVGNPTSLMLISFGNHAQFGNHYLAAAHRVAHALSNDYSLHLFELSQARDYLDAANLPEQIRVGGPFLQQIAGMTDQLVRRCTRKKDFHLGFVSIHFDRHGRDYLDGKTISDLAKKQVVIHQGWSFRDKEALKAQVDRVRQILEFKEVYRAAAKERFDRARGRSKFVIGVHVRRGDYEKFCGGRYFFKDDEYLRIASEAVAAQKFDPTEVVVIGFSNENLDWPDKCGGARVVTGQGRWWEDFLCLSLCDLIIGPPSTFSGSASFARNVRWFQITDRDAPFNPSEALPCLESGIRVE